MTNFFSDRHAGTFQVVNNGTMTAEAHADEPLAKPQIHHDMIKDGMSNKIAPESDQEKLDPGENTHIPAGPVEFLNKLVREQAVSDANLGEVIRQKQVSNDQVQETMLLVDNREDKVQQENSKYQDHMAHQENPEDRDPMVQQENPEDQDSMVQHDHSEDQNSLVQLDKHDGVFTLPELVKVDYTFDLWVYSVFYDPGHGRNSSDPVIRAVGLASEEMPNNYDLRFHLLHPDGTSDTAVGRAVRGKGQSYGARYIHVILESSLPIGLTPASVAFSSRINTTMSDRITVNYPNLRQKKRISVCYGVLHGGFNEVDKFQQNVEFNLQMGAEHFTVYNQSVGPEMEALLRFYTDRGIFSVLTLPVTHQVSNSFYLGQHLAHLDCHARMKHTSTYVALLDSDEYMMPLQNSSWTDLIEFLEREHETFQSGTTIAAIGFPHVYYNSYPPNEAQWDVLKRKVPLSDNDIAFINHTNTVLFLEMNRLEFSANRRTKRKTIFRPDLIVEVGVHQPWGMLPNTSSLVVGNEVGLLAHHRRSVHDGIFQYKPQPYYRHFLDRYKKAFGGFTKYLIQTKEQRNNFPARPNLLQSLPEDIRAQRTRLIPMMEGIKKDGQDAWIAYPARLMVDGNEASLNAWTKKLFS